MSKKYFGTDGIRGRVNQNKINGEMFFKFGLAAGTYFKNQRKIKQTAIIAKDTRLSGYTLEPALVSGLTSAGMHVYTLGPLPTNGLAMLTKKMKANMGIMITASHNPKNYNGLKLCNAGALPIGENSGLKDIKKLADADVDVSIEEFHNNDEHIVEKYYEHLKNLVSPESISQKLAFGIDGGNGVFGAVFDNLNNIYKFNTKSIYLEVDGNFPNHPADPSDENNLTDLKSLLSYK